MTIDSRIAAPRSDLRWMQLSPDPPGLNPNSGQVFRHNPLSDLLAVAIVFGMLAAGGYALTRIAGELPWIAWLVAGPIALVAGGLLLIAGFAVLGAFASSLKPTNWLAFVDADGVSLNLRSYRNGHFEGDGPTVLFLAWREIESVGHVTELLKEVHNRKQRTLRTRTIDLHLDGVDTTPIADACRIERNLAAPTTRVLGVTSRTKHHDIPVFVPEPGVVRVEWNGGLYRRLVHEVRERTAAIVDLEEALAGLPVEERVARLVLRGKRFAAARVATRELALGTREAKEWVREVGKRAA